MRAICFHEIHLFLSFPLTSHLIEVNHERFFQPRKFEVSNVQRELNIEIAAFKKRQVRTRYFRKTAGDSTIRNGRLTSRDRIRSCIVITSVTCDPAACACITVLLVDPFQTLHHPWIMIRWIFSCEILFPFMYRGHLYN